MRKSMLKEKSIRFILSFMAILLMFTLRAVTLGPGEMLDWDANKPAAADVVEATGGTIVFNSSVTVANNIHLGGEVSVVINNGASVRFTKTFFKTNPSGRLVLPCAVRFGCGRLQAAVCGVCLNGGFAERMDKPGRIRVRVRHHDCVLWRRYGDG